MRILILAKTKSELPSYRFRIEQFLPLLKENGIDYDIVDCRDIKKGNLDRLQGYDVVLIQKHIYPASWVHKASQIGPKLVFDVDDAIWMSYKKKWTPYMAWKERRRVATIARRSSVVIAGNSYLADHFRGLGADTVIVPTCLDTRRYHPVRRIESDGVFRIGWIGSGHNLSHMEMLEPALKSLSTHAKVRLVIVSDVEYVSPSIPSEFHRWSLEDELESLRHFDIGVMPISDDAWGRGKCGFKLLQYMACGIPCVGSPVGVNADIVHDGENGFLAKDCDEWYEKLSMLCEHRECWDRIAANGRATVEERFSREYGAELLAKVLRDVAGVGGA